jgi:hypothetical protein
MPSQVKHTQAGFSRAFRIRWFTGI